MDVFCGKFLFVVVCNGWWCYSDIILTLQQGCKMNNYMILCQNGWSEYFKAKSDRAAKVYATKQLSHGCGNMSLCKSIEGGFLEILGYRMFWQKLNKFGWKPWKR